MRFKDKVVLITGGNGGIGFATAKLFVNEGARVIITGRDQSTLDSSVKILGQKARAFRADVLNKDEREVLFKGIREEFGTLDVVFANAGIMKPTPIGSTAEDTFDEILRVNVTGVFMTIQSALPLLKRGSSIILNGSIISTIGAPGTSAYAASKAGVRSMTRVLAAELSSKGIRINIVVPGATRTAIWGKTEAANERLDKISASIPLHRIGDAEEIAKAVLFLSSEESSYIQGAEIVVDGGSSSLPAGAPIYLAK
ncbi:SDR family oxidoreductase [Leptospira stimsonii]|uniref:SDR family oxidoreductase n=1 Tax=Leptospira stimsonii TaxID=2202203 RepID=A0A4V3JUU0_9LEPT|nr:SDR family oxidoreductase [Leptospira stimsonii]RHX86442.1 short-chain dehydrogenase [Leptospira stimsonii]TGK14441.1 SDR family oxidoreductase [Leptospira stimsonii]TGM11804.1 SDR family oxidoreductase [Leptospira stimsonii]